MDDVFLAAVVKRDLQGVENSAPTARWPGGSLIMDALGGSTTMLSRFNQFQLSLL